MGRTASQILAGGALLLIAPLWLVGEGLSWAGRKLSGLVWGPDGGP
jgi:hypothetical protein